MVSDSLDSAIAPDLPSTVVRQVCYRSWVCEVVGNNEVQALSPDVTRLVGLRCECSGRLLTNTAASLVLAAAILFLAGRPTALPVCQTSAAVIRLRTAIALVLTAPLLLAV